MSIKLKDDTIVACGNSDISKCTYSALATAMPAVVSVALTDSATITFTGTDFFTTGYTASASFNMILADEVTITDATTAVAKWNKGVPVVSTDSIP